MKVLILAGGYGTRLSEETDIRPKPMVEIGGKPILWHIMKIYSFYGFNDFVILCGYKSYFIKEYFANYFLHQSDVCFDMANNQMEIINSHCEPWKVTLVDTGLETMTGGRIKRAKDFLKDDEEFLLTYGDGLSDINISSLVDFHHSHNGLLTMSAILPEGKFGALDIAGDKITSFFEKPKGDANKQNAGFINGGFFVANRAVLDFLDGDNCVFEQTPLKTLANMGEMYAYKHYGFWKCMDTLRDKTELNAMWNSNKAQWKVWN